MTRIDPELHRAGAGLELDELMTVELRGRDTFVGVGRDYGPLRIYGGHLLGQALAAGFGTVAEPMLAHSLHGYFLKTGEPNEPIDYQVERLRDGRSYATRSVRVVQADQLLATLTVSFKNSEPGDEHQPPMREVGDPAVLRRHDSSGALTMPFSAGLDVELVPVDDWRPQAPPAELCEIVLWMRAGLSARADLRARQCVLAYLSDSTLMFNALRPHGNAFATHRTTSLDHSLWFHADADPDRWLLYDQSGPVAGDSRGLNFGRIYAADGRLVASTAQEAMMRRL